MDGDNLPAVTLHISIKIIPYIILAYTCPLNSLLKIKNIALIVFFSPFYGFIFFLIFHNLSLVAEYLSLTASFMRNLKVFRVSLVSVTYAVGFE